MTFAKDRLAVRLDNIQPISGIHAISPTSQAEGAHLESAATVAQENSLDSREALAFEKAGWKFAKTASATGSPNVVIDNDGRMKVLTNALNVKFDPSLPRSDVESILSRNRLSVRRDLGFSPNLFLVTGDGDAVEKAKLLNDLDDVVYAEPVLIEALGHRGR